MVAGNTVALDMLVNGLKNIPDWRIYSVQDGELKPWQQVSSAAVVRDLVITEGALQEQVQVIAAQIQHWGRLQSIAQRAWSMCESLYRTWYAVETAALLEPPADPKKADFWKKPTEKALEAGVRALPEYWRFQNMIETAQESYEATHSVLDGFRAKLDMLKLSVFRGREDAAPRLNV